MTIRKTLSIMSRLSMFALFVLGLVWVIRFESLGTLLGGVLLMLFSVPVSYELASAIEHNKALQLASIIKANAFTFPVVGPIILLFVFMSSMSYYSETGDVRSFGIFLLLVPPLISVLIDAMQGEREWQFAGLFSAWLHALSQMLSRMLYLAGGLILLVFAVLAVVSLFISLGDLIRQMLFAEGVFTAPVLCGLSFLERLNCSVWLSVWHVLSVLILVILWRYGDRLLNWVDSIFIRA